MCSALTMQPNYSEYRGRCLTLPVYFFKVRANRIRDLDFLSFFLVDELLEVLWYDPQGCIRTSPIDIIEQLPLLVVLIQAQRRSGYLHGLRNTAVPGNFELIKEVTPRFQLVGRMTSGGELRVPTTATSTGTQTSSDDKATSFLKSSWPEDVRPREHYIIATAIERTKTLLPEEYQHFVLDHIPTVSASSEIYDSSTTIIRTLLDLSTDGARTQCLMCSDLLSNLLDVANNFEFFKGILHAVVRGMFIHALSPCPHD